MTAAEDSTRKHQNAGTQNTEKPPAPRLEIISGPDAGRHYPLTQDCVVLGRSDLADLPLTDLFAARRHACLTRTAAGYQLEDLHSPNGTYLNDRQIRAATPLHSEDRLAIGQTIILYRV